MRLPRGFSAIPVVLAGAWILGQASSCLGQDELSPRTLYYNSGTEAEPKHPAKRPASATTTPANASPVQPVSAPMPSPPAVTHLGVRYNLLLVDSGSGSKQTVDPATTFHANDCLAVDVQANYDGYLYVMNRGSSGKWDVLLPSADMPEESNMVKARTTVQAPSGYCFTVDDPAGTEHLYLIFSRNPEDVAGLNAALRASKTTAAAAPSSNGHAVEAMHMPSVAGQMARLEQVMAARDLKITKVSTPMAAGEPANAVYVVDAAAKASDRIVTEIQIRHN